MAQQRGHHSRKSFAITTARLPGTTQQSFEIGSEFRIGEQLNQSIERRVDGIVQDNEPHWLSFLMQARRHIHTRETTIAANEFGLCHFRKIVILGGYPEDGHSLRVPLTQAACKFDSGKRFVNRVKRSGEQACLLAGYYSQAV